MRDDLSDLFHKLVLLYKAKEYNLEKISANKIQLRYLLQSGNVPAMLDLIRADNDLLIKLDSIEFDIQSLIGNISKTAGIDRSNFKNYFFDRCEDPLPELKKLSQDTDKKLSELIKEEDRLIKAMEQKKADIKIDIDTLKRIRELEIY